MNCFLLETIFLFSVSFSILFTTTADAYPIQQLGNETDRLSLLAFKHQLLYDPLHVMSSWNESTHFCQWEGVVCGRRHQRVVWLNLSSRGLVGHVSPYIGNLSFLRIIRLENNTLQGSYASIYKGVLRADGYVIAVKIFNLMARSASKSFKAECEVLRRLRHRNLLKILTVCSSVDFDGNDFKALILEFMPNGSLEDWLHPSLDRSQMSPRKLNLLQMLNITIDVVSALDYLHNHNEAPIVHCDLKPSNVLLDKDLVACIGDFGIAKFLNKSNSSFDRSETNSIVVRGTVGYIPPEYGMGSTVSTQGDVYSFGIMLLEMFTGKRPTNEMFGDTLSLHNFCKVNLVEGDMDILNINPLIEIEDDTIVNIEEKRCMEQSMKKCSLAVIEIGVACSSDAIDNRMKIKDVLTKMQKIKGTFVKVMNVGENITMESHI